MNVEEKSGIYSIICNKNGKFYIGSTKNLKKREQGHFLALKKNIHPNKKLQNAFNKYGKQNFTFEIEKFCSVETLIKNEQFYLDTLLFTQEFIQGINKKFLKLGFNLIPKAHSKRSKKYKAKKINIRKKRIPWNKGLTKETDKRVKKCSKKLQGRKLEEKHIKNISKGKTGKKFKPRNGEWKKNLAYANRKEVICINLISGEILNFTFMRDAALFFNCSSDNIRYYILKNKILKNYKISFKKK